jgi:hypothetical protein
LNFSQLVKTIIQTHETLKAQAARAVNISLALRNWLIGYYICEYRLNGSDHAAYGEKVFEKLAGQLMAVSNCNKRQLYRYFNFYRVYPRIVGTLSPQFKKYLPESINAIKMGTLPSHFEPKGYSVIKRNYGLLLKSRLKKLIP